jgi:HD-GYP domain-containing protein (c-di-GMP phosphodiesterase class II)
MVMESNTRTYEASPPRETPQERVARQISSEFVLAFYRLLKEATFYKRYTQGVDFLSGQCLHTLNSIVKAHGHLSLKIIRDVCFLNNTRIHVSADQFALFKAFIKEMRRRWIGEIEFRSELTPAQLRDLIFLLLELEDNNEGNFLYMKRELERRGLPGIDVGKLDLFKDELAVTDSESRRRLSKEVYFKTLDFLKTAMDNARTSRVMQVRKIKRLMLNAVNLLMMDESSLLGLANIKSYDDYTFNHCVNVAIYAMALGQRIGIPKKYLSFLGMAGLFHDVGKLGVTKDILNKPGPLESDEWEVIHRHPLLGAEIIMGLKEWGELSTRMIAVAFEHHVKYDLSGYPRLSRPRKTALFSRIITIADCFDALGRPRVYRKHPYVSEKILGMMLERSGKDFDPLLVKVFINMIGIYPLGSLVRLSTEEMGVVVQVPQDSQMLHRPKVLLLNYADGQYTRDATVDLAERDDVTQEFTRTILRTLDPNDYHINVAEYFL